MHKNIDANRRMVNNLLRAKSHKKFFLFLTLIIILTTLFPVHAEDSWPALKDVKADSYIVIDQNSGNVLLESNSSKKINPASLTKVLTATIALEKIDLSKEILVSKTAVMVSDNESQIDLIEGERMSFQNLLYGLLVASGNDAALAIAEAVSGDSKNFVELMNTRSMQIGAVKSSWSNPQGITADKHYTTSHDLAIITRYALKNETFKKVVDTAVYSMPITNKHPYNGWNILENTNKLLRYQEEYFKSNLLYEISGVKTGTTTAAGSNLIATAHTKSGLQLICVLNGVRGDQSKNIWAYARTLLEEAAKINTGMQSILKENTPVTILETKESCFPAESFSIFLGDSQPVDVSIIKSGDSILVKSTKDNLTLFQTTALNEPSKEKMLTSQVSETSFTSSRTSNNSDIKEEPGNFTVIVVCSIILIGVLVTLLTVYIYKKR